MTPSFFVIGANHRTWAGSIRDRLFAETVEIPLLLERVRGVGVSQAIWLSTCDRVEIQAVHADPTQAALGLAAVLAERAGLPPDGTPAPFFYSLRESAALRHAFAVASALDSQVVGEPHVLGQVKAAYRLSVAAGMAGSELAAVMQAAFAVAKRVRNETTVAERPTSIAAAAVDIARDLHGDLRRLRGLLIGLGDMGGLMVDHLRQAGLDHWTVLNPLDRRAEMAAQRLQCHFAPFAELGARLAAADIVVTAVGMGRHCLGVEPVRTALRLRRHQPMFIIDAALPTDVDPDVGTCDAAFVYDLVDLERVALRGRVSREAAATAAWAIIDQAVLDFGRGRAEREASPTVAALRRHFEGVRQEVLAVGSGLDAAEATRRLVNRLLHAPCQALRRLAGEAGACADTNTDAGALAERQATERVLRVLFPLEGAFPPDRQGQDHVFEQVHVFEQDHALEEERPGAEPPMMSGTAANGTIMSGTIISGTEGTSP